MLRRVEIVDAALRAMGDGRLGRGERAEAARAAHKIAGSAGSFGFSSASDAAREIELTLRDEAAGDQLPRLRELVARIKSDFGVSGT